MVLRSFPLIQRRAASLSGDMMLLIIVAKSWERDAMNVHDHVEEKTTNAVAVIGKTSAAADELDREEARRQAQELITRFGLGKKAFAWRTNPGVGILARQLILNHPEWDNAMIAGEVRSRLNSRTTPGCISFYARIMKVARPRRRRSR